MAKTAHSLGIEKLTSSFGLVTMCQGLSAFIGAPIAVKLEDHAATPFYFLGALSDIAGYNYKGAFYMAGAAIALSGAICFPLRRISKWENRDSEDGSPNAGILFNSNLELQVIASGNV